MLTASPDPWEWGWAAVEALAVVAALIAAGVAVLLEMKAGRRLAEEAERGRENERQRLAAGVAVWPSGDSVEDPQRRPRSVTYRTVTLTNSTAVPVTDVFVLIRDERGDAPRETYFAPVLHVLAPGGSYTFDLPPDMPFGDTENPQDVGMLKVRFIDGNGRRWERDGRGRLRDLDAEPYA